MIVTLSLCLCYYTLLLEQVVLNAGSADVRVHIKVNLHAQCNSAQHKRSAAVAVSCGSSDSSACCSSSDCRIVVTDVHE
jgi:hypothetical protein